MNYKFYGKSLKKEGWNCERGEISREEFFSLPSFQETREKGGEEFAKVKSFLEKLGYAEEDPCDTIAASFGIYCPEDFRFEIDGETMWFYFEVESKFSLFPNLEWESGNGAHADRFAIEEGFDTKEAAEKFFIEEIAEEYEKFDNLSAAIDAAHAREGRYIDVLTYDLVEWSEDGSEGNKVKSEVIDGTFFVVEKF